MTPKNLLALAVGRLSQDKPKEWDKSRKWFLKHGGTEKIWNEALGVMERRFSDKWDEYKGVDNSKIPWDKVVFRDVRQENNRFTFEFFVDRRIVVVTCTDKELDTPDAMVRRLELALCREIECPYRYGRMRDLWRKEYLFHLLGRG